jgi:predicted nicotinamide N-methyase
MEQILAENLTDEVVHVAGHDFYIERIKNCEVLLDHMNQAEFDKDERLPYWAELWPSSVGLAGFILENRDEFRTKSVLELGCGLGLAGIAAHRAGARVLFTDYDRNALSFTAKNFFRNFNLEADVQLMDWRKPKRELRFDIIIGADVLYENRWLEPVLDTLGQMLANNGIAFIAEPGRQIASRFFVLLEEDNWNFKKFSQNIRIDNRDKQVDIYRINKC